MYNNLEELKQSFSNCQKCKLCKTRNNIVFGSGVYVNDSEYITII